MTLKRVPGWNARFDAFVSVLNEKSLEYGSFDCGVGLASGAIYALTLVDVGADWRGAYSTAEEAALLLTERGFASIDELIASILEPRSSVAMAQRGDIAIVDDGRGNLAFGVFDREYVIVMRLTGRGFVDRRDAIKAYAVV